MRYIAFLAALIAALTLAPPAAAADWAWPVRGDVVTPYKNGDDPYASGQHRGIDIAAPVGTRVVAAVGGRVTYAGTAGSSGLTVSVRTADGRYDVSYLHLSSAAVQDGDAVDAGEQLGAVGLSGRRSVAQPHLHFGVREAGERHAYLDPLNFLPLLGPAPTDSPPRAVPVASPDTVAAPPATAPALARAPDPLTGPGPLPVGAAVAGLAAPHGEASPQSDASGRTLAGEPARAAASIGSDRSAGLGSARPDPDGSPAANRAGSPAANRVRSNDVIRAASPAGPPGPRRITRADLAAPRGEAGPAPGKAQLALPDRRGAAPHADPGGLNLGWLAAVVGLVTAATCLGRPQTARRATRRSRAVLSAALRPLAGRA